MTNNKNGTFNIISAVCFALSAVLRFLAVGFYISIITILSCLFFLILSVSLFYKNKFYISLSLILSSLVYIINLINIFNILKMVAFLSAACIVYLSRNKKTLAKRTFYIPSIIIIASVIVPDIVEMSTHGFEFIWYYISDFLLVPALFFVGLWAIKYDEPQKNNSSVISSVNKSSDADRLLKLKELLDSGAITQEEYEAKKKQILNL